eukprot:gene2233-17385_t
MRRTCNGMPLSEQQAMCDPSAEQWMNSTPEQRDDDIHFLMGTAAAS